MQHVMTHEMDFLLPSCPYFFGSGNWKLSFF